MNPIELFLISISVSSSTILILLIKHIMMSYEFTWPVSLASYHFFNIFIFLELSVNFKLIPRLKAGFSIKILMFACISVAGRIFQNFNLLNNSIGYYQLSKFSINVVLDLINTVYNKEKLSIYPIFAWILIIFANVIYFIKDNQICVKGVIYATLSVVFLSLSQFCAFLTQKRYNVSGPTIQHSISYYESTISLVLTYILDFKSENSILSHGFTNTESSLIILSGFIAIISNAVTISLLTGNSKVNFQYIDHFKSILLFLLGFIAFPITESQQKSNLLYLMFAFFLGIAGSVIISLYKTIANSSSTNQDQDQFGVEPENEIKIQESRKKKTIPIVRKLLEDLEDSQDTENGI